MSNEFESWKYSNRYECYVSNYGNVKSKYNRMLSLCDDGYGYYIVNLGRKIGTKRVHLIVADAFIPNPYKLSEINHRDENGHNNCVWNLEWCTSSYNKLYGTRIKRELKTKCLNGSCNAEKPVIQFTKDGKFVSQYPSISEAARKTNIERININLCCLGKRKSAGGSVWQFVA